MLVKGGFSGHCRCYRLLELALVAVADLLMTFAVVVVNIIGTNVLLLFI